MRLGLPFLGLRWNKATASAPDGVAPTVTASQSFSYPENSAASTVIGTVLATDNVAVTQFRFTATGTSTSADTYFSINNGGVLSLTAAGAAAPSRNDYETNSSTFTYSVQAGDAANNWSAGVNVTLQITDVDDTLPVVTGSQSFNYAENQASGYTIGTVLATDNVAVTQFRFGATGTNTSSDGYFQISNAGVLTLTPAGAAGTANDYDDGSNSFTPTVQAGDAAGNWSVAVAATINVTDVDDTAPVLSSPTGVETGSTTATVGATTDEGNGTLYAVITTSNTQPSVAQIKAGQDHTGAAAVWADDVAVASTGAKTLDATGLSATTTYYAHLVQTDAASNNSNRVSSTSFLTDSYEYIWNFSTADDTDTAAVNPTIGNVLTLSGAAATANSNRWEKDTGVYSGGGMVASIDTDFELMVIATMNVGTATNSSYSESFRVGVAPFIMLLTKATTEEALWYVHNGTDEIYSDVMPFDATDRVYWMKYDPATSKWAYGFDSTYQNVSGAAGDTPSAAFPPSVNEYIALGSEPNVIGVSRVINRNGIDIEDEVALVATENGEYDPNPPPVGMRAGMNLGAISTFGGAVPFANIAYNAMSWDRVTGSSDWTDDQGILTPVSATDEFRAYISDSGIGIPTGDYTLRFTGTGQMGVGNFGSPYLLAYSSAGTYTVTYATGAMHVWAKGEIDSWELIIPGHVTSYDAGNIWNSQFLSYQTTLDTSPIRFMDWLSTNGNIDTAWGDRVQPNKPTLSRGKGSGSGVQCNTTIPWEFILDLCNRLNKDPWINIPTRADATYVANLAAMFNDGTNAVAHSTMATPTGLESGRVVHVEGVGNEIWNTASGFRKNTMWVEYLDHTKRTGTVNAATDTVTTTGHGLSDGDIILSFWTKAQLEAGISLNSAPGTDWWTLADAYPVYVNAIDANSFQCYIDAGLTTIIPIPAGVTDFLWLKTTEAGKTANQHEHYSELSVRNWDAFTTAMGGTTRVKRILATQAAAYGVLSSRLAVTGTSAKTDGVSIATYFAGWWFGGAVDIASGTLTPKFWSNKACRVYVNLWTSGSTPSLAARIAGTGALFHQQVDHTYANGWTSFTTRASANGTNREQYITVRTEDYDGNYYYWDMSETVAANAVSSTTYMYLTTAQQNLLNRLDNCVGRDDLPSVAGMVDGNIAVAGGKPIYAYEGGLHFHETITFGVAPQQLRDWMCGTYQESAEFADAIDKNQRLLASYDEVEVACYFSDINGKATHNSFSLTDTNYVTTPSYDLIAAYGGGVPRNPVPNPTITPVEQDTDPGTLPAVLTSLDAAYTYQIMYGNEDAHFDFDGEDLRLIDDTGINWASGNVFTLGVLVTGDGIDVMVEQPVTLGVAPVTWYESDALLAWSSLTDSDNANMDPDKGGVMAKDAGAGAIISGGYWDFTSSSHYGSSTALTAGIDFSKPIFIALTIDRNGYSGADDATGHTFGQYPQVFGGLITTSGTTFTWQVTYTVNQAYYTVPLAASGTKRVVWVFVDVPNSKVYYGYNQTESNAGGGDALPGDWDTTTSLTGSHFGLYEPMFGAFEVVNRTGMTLAQAKACVQKIQDHHSL